jgi:hypothetical protein
MAIENFTEPKVVWINTGPMTLTRERPAAEPQSDGSRHGWFSRSRNRPVAAGQSG